MRKTVIVLLTVIILTAVGGYFGYQYYQSIAPTSELSASGIIEAAEVTISSQLSGTIKAIKTNEGDSIKQGEQLAIIDAPLMKAQKQQAEAGIITANADIKQVENGSDAEKEAAQAELKQAQAQLDAANIQLDYTRVKSPIKGTVISIPINKGENVIPGTPIAVIADLSELSVDIYISEKQIGKVKLGRKVTVEVDSYPKTKFSGKIIKIANKPEFTPANIETKEQRVKLVYAVTVRLAHSGDKLKPGMPADISFKPIR